MKNEDDIKKEEKKSHKIIRCTLVFFYPAPR